MSATNRFEQEYSNYANQLSAYKERALQIKELAMMKPEDALKQAGETIGEQLGVHLFTKGFSTAVAKGKNYVQSLQNKATSAVQDAKNTVSQKIAQVQDNIDRTKTSIQQQVDDVNTNVSNEVSSAVRAANGQTAGEAAVSKASYDQTFSNPVYDPDSAPEPTMSDPTEAGAGYEAYGLETGEAPAAFTQFRASLDPIVAANPEVDQFSSNLFPEGAGGRVNLSSYFGVPRAQPGTTSNRLGNLLQQQRQQAAPVQAPDNPPAQANVPDAQEAERVASEQQSNVQTLESSGLTQAQAEEAASADLPAVQDGKLLDPEETAKALAASEEGATAGAEAGAEAGAVGAEEAGEDIAAATGAETGGIGDVVGGLLAIGGLLAGVFAGHHSAPPPPPVQLPNLSIPVFQAGLGDN